MMCDVGRERVSEFCFGVKLVTLVLLVSVIGVWGGAEVQFGVLVWYHCGNIWLVLLL